jgi:hypothetical protein
LVEQAIPLLAAQQRLLWFEREIDALLAAFDRVVAQMRSYQDRCHIMARR